MNRFVIEIEMIGDFGSIECAIDGIIASIPFVELDAVNVEIKNDGVIESD